MPNPCSARVRRGRRARDPGGLDQLGAVLRRRPRRAHDLELAGNLVLGRLVRGIPRLRLQPSLARSICFRLSSVRTLSMAAAYALAIAAARLAEPAWAVSWMRSVSAPVEVVTGSARMLPLNEPACDSGRPISLAAALVNVVVSTSSASEPTNSRSPARQPRYLRARGDATPGASWG